MKPPLPSATSLWHNDTYDRISPSRDELSVAGKTVIITGAGSGIGREAAVAFASAGAKKAILLGRDATKLTETQNHLRSSNTSCVVHSLSVTDEKALKHVAAEVGEWDILVLNAGFFSSPAPVVEAAVDDWWQSFETNVKGTMTSAKAFLPTAHESGAVIIGVTSGVIGLPPVALPGLSAYITSKLAQVKFLEFLAAENPNIFVASMHPGIIDTDMFRKSGSKAEEMPMDQGLLSAHFMVWLASPEARFLRGKLVWANWDVEELMARTQEIQTGQQMTAGIIEWPFPFCHQPS